MFIHYYNDLVKVKTIFIISFLVYITYSETTLDKVTVKYVDLTYLFVGTKY